MIEDRKKFEKKQHIRELWDRFKSNRIRMIRIIRMIFLEENGDFDEEPIVREIEKNLPVLRYLVS